MARTVNCIKLGIEAEGLDFRLTRVSWETHLAKRQQTGLGGLAQTSNHAGQ
jgi:hypothetical protein